MPLGFTYWVKKYGFNKPLLCSAILGISFILVGAILEDSTLIDVGIVIYVIVFFLSFIWIIISKLRKPVDSNNLHSIG